MYCQGLTGSQIAENWRRYDPNQGIQFNWKEYGKLFYGESIATLNNLREQVLRGTWALDWEKIRASPVEGTFNVYNFSKHELEVLAPAQMDEDFLAAAVSLPMWFPPVRKNGQTYIDSVYITDANLEEAIRRGADEIWVIWTVSDKDEWHDGFIAQYFQIIETASNGHFRRICKRIEANNAALSSGHPGEFGRPIELKILKADVPLHYLIDLSQDRIVETVNRGVEEARQWCQLQGIALKPGADHYPTDVHNVTTKLAFTEEMKGFVQPGDTAYAVAYEAGKQNGHAFMFHLTIEIDGVNRFVSRPEHEAGVSGYIQSELFGGQRKVEGGLFNLFIDQADPARKHMLYRLYFRDGEGQPLTLSGFKDIKDDPGFDLWSDTTTLYTRILRGHVDAKAEAQASVVATGILKIYLTDFLKQLTTFRVEGPTLSDRASAFGRFGRLFLGKLWDVYARDILTSGPF